jgi:predicted membrane-bound dolichyl-phosphate-mannose-protein mannosyltransferase
MMPVPLPHRENHRFTGTALRLINGSWRNLAVGLAVHLRPGSVGIVDRLQLAVEWDAVVVTEVAFLTKIGVHLAVAASGRFLARDAALASRTGIAVLLAQVAFFCTIRRAL